MITEQCKTFLQSLDEYLDKTLEPGRQAEIERHLEQCAHCRHELEAHQRIIASLRQLERKPAPETLPGQVLARLQGRGARIPWRARIQSLVSLPKLRVALEIAAVFVAVFIGWQIFNAPSLQLRPGQRKAAAPAQMGDFVAGVEYDTTNGTVSGGEIVRFGRPPSSSVPLTPGETAEKSNAEVTREGVKLEATFGSEATKPLKEAGIEKAMQESFARRLAPESEAEVVVPSSVPAEKAVEGRLAVQEERVHGGMIATPVPATIEKGEEVRKAQVQEPAPLPSVMAKPERSLTGEEERGGVEYLPSRSFIGRENMPTEEALRAKQAEVDIKAKSEAGVTDFLAATSPQAPTVAPELPKQPAMARGELVVGNGIVSQGELPRSLNSPVQGRSTADKDFNKTLFTKLPEEGKSRIGVSHEVPATLVISAAPGQAGRIVGASVSAPGLNEQSKVVEQTLRQNRGRVLSMQESKDEIKMTSLLPASGYRKFVEQLERKGFTINREILPKLADREREEEAHAPKAQHRFYDLFQFRGQTESREPIAKKGLVKEAPSLGLVERRSRVEAKPTPVIVSEPSISITIIIQGASPSSTPTP